jgi:predicted amidophosphoribosyltransferase
MAIKLTGSWTEGYALYYHVISSEYVGEDVYGEPIFNNKRTEIGELLYKMKYNGHNDTSEGILKLAIPFLDEWLENKKVDIVLPVPPTKIRDIQPLFIIAEMIATYYKIPFTTDVLAKANAAQAKNKDTANISISLLKNAKRKCNILLIDDLFSTGATISECVKVLKDDDLVNDIYVLSVTKTKEQ